MPGADRPSPATSICWWSMPEQCAMMPMRSSGARSTSGAWNPTCTPQRNMRREEKRWNAWSKTASPCTALGSPRMVNQGGRGLTFDEVLAQVDELLRREGRVSYRALRRRFDLDEEYLEDVKAEIIQAKRLAM